MPYKFLSFFSISIVAVLVISCDISGSKDELKTPFPCEDGFAKGFPCNNVGLFAHLSILELAGDTVDNQGIKIEVNDIWGWTDPETNKEYALVGLTNGVSFVDISDPENPKVLGVLGEVLNSSSVNKTANALHDEEGKKASAWRDIKTHKNHAFIVSDAQPHGLQVFDLTKLRNVESVPADFEEDAHYSEFGNAHNIAINEETEFAYVVGSDTYGGGLHIIDIQNPTSPVFAGFHSDSTVGRSNTGYVHDTQCVIYKGPDMKYQNDELCFNSSETHLVIANVSEKNNTTTISANDYVGNEYAHQGWLTEDHRYFLLDDELDELNPNNTINNTTTYIWDVQDLDNPEVIGTYTSNSTTIDHNQYVKGKYVYQSNYTSGLRILDLTNIENTNHTEAGLTEAGYFDSFPEDNDRKFDGNWSNYPFFESGLIILSDISNGLFIVLPDLN